ncbi:hypothetical protein SK128_004833 [Halocaridina rubra]|uniref:Uncharacterized protein n=1 Tax=Halocaridina rubra TaxID=373956 RepID=A0AAN8WMY3_HALRR
MDFTRSHCSEDTDTDTDENNMVSDSEDEDELNAATENLQLQFSQWFLDIVTEILYQSQRDPLSVDALQTAMQQSVLQNMMLATGYRTKCLKTCFKHLNC